MNQNQRMPAVLVLAALLGWTGLIALQFMDPEEPSPSPSPEPELTEPTPPSLLDTLTSDQRRSLEIEFDAPPAEIEEPVPAPHAGLAVRLVDERTGEPPADLEVLVRGPDGREETLRTDAGGLAVARESWPESAVLLDLSGNAHPRDLVQSKRTPERLKGAPIELELPEDRESALPIELSVPVGPTYTLDLRGSPGGLGAHELDAVLTTADPRQAFDKVYARVRPGVPPWVRFGPLATVMDSGPPWRLELISDDGLWSGAAEVQAVVGVHPEPLVVELAARARLFGRLLAPDGKPPARSWVQLWGEGASTDDPDNRPEFVLSDADGVYDFRALEPGRFTLKAEVDRHEPVEEVLELVTGQTIELDVALVAETRYRLGRIEAIVTSETGTFDGELSAVAVVSGDVHSTSVTWEGPEDARVGRFEFEDVYGESAGVSVFGPHLFEVLPSNQPADHLSEEVLEFEVLDGGEHVTLSFEVIADRVRRPVREFELRVEIRRGAEPHATTLRTEDGVVHLRGLAPGETYSWRLRTEGHAPLWGEGVAPALDQSEVLRPRLGFGLEVLVRDSTGDSISGASILFDDAEVAVTDDDGLARVHADAAPERIRAIYRDWVPTEKSALTADGTWRARQDRLSVILAPPE